MPDAPGAKANSKAAKARQNPEVGLCTSTLHPAGRSYGNPDPEFYPQMSVTKHLPQINPQKHRRAMDPCKIYDFIWIHINNEINYIWNQPLEPVLMELLCFSGWGTLTTLTGSCGQHDAIWWIRTLVGGTRRGALANAFQWGERLLERFTDSLKIIETYLNNLKHRYVEKCRRVPNENPYSKTHGFFVSVRSYRHRNDKFMGLNIGHAHFAIILLPFSFLSGVDSVRCFYLNILEWHNPSKSGGKLAAHWSRMKNIIALLYCQKTLLRMLWPLPFSENPAPLFDAMVAVAPSHGTVWVLNRAVLSAPNGGRTQMDSACSMAWPHPAPEEHRSCNPHLGIIQALNRFQSCQRCHYK